MTIRERIKSMAIELAKKDLGSEYGYMGMENAGHYALASIEVIQELSDRIAMLERERKNDEGRICILEQWIEDHKDQLL